VKKDDFVILEWDGGVIIMAYTKEFWAIVDKDISDCEREYREGDKTSRGKLHTDLVSKYNSIIPGFDDGLRSLFYDDDGTRRRDNLETIRQKLSVFKAMHYEKVKMSADANENKVKGYEIRKDSVFIVHGHDGEMKEAVARLIENQGLRAIILNEQVNQGLTIIEKFEKYSDVGAAICLFTADDIGSAKTSDVEMSRARQNVVFETGYFIGKLGRERIIIIADKEVEIPSDLQGVVYSDSTYWRYEVLKGLDAIGYNIDMNKLLR